MAGIVSDDSSYISVRPASVAQRQSVGLRIDRSRVRNSLVPSGYSIRQKNSIGIARWPSSLGMLIMPTRHHCSRIGGTQFHSIVNEYLVLALGEETAVQVVVGSIVWALRDSKSQGVGEKPPAATRFIACAPNFYFFLHSYEFDDPEFVKMKKALDDVTEMFADGLSISDFFPILTYLPFDLPDVRKMKVIFNVLYDMLREKLRTHKETYKASK